MAFSAPRCPGFYQLWCKGAKFLICCWWWLARAGFLGSTSGKEPSCQWRRLKRRGFDSWIGKIPWRRAWQPTPVFLPGESPWTEEPGGVQTMGSQRGGHDCWDLAHTHTVGRGPWWFYYLHCKSKSTYFSEGPLFLAIVHYCILPFPLKLKKLL